VAISPVVLVIMDGFGLLPSGPGNAISLARTPSLDRLMAEWPHATLNASGEAVGLPAGQIGNSEVGHLNIGAGRIVYQELSRINCAIADGSLEDNEVLCTAIDSAVNRDGAVHFMGLLSDGGVHSHQEHLYALIRMAAARGARRIFVHAYLDGRDVPPKSAMGFVAKLEAFLGQIGVGRIATVSGRYYAMDRDTHWERVQRAWAAMVMGEGRRVLSAAEAIRASYDAGVTDEFVEPSVIIEDDLPVGLVSSGDALVFFNFRPDRARQIARAFTDPVFDGFVRPVVPNVSFVCLTGYDPTILAPVAFPKQLPCCVLADVISQAGMRQLHIAETEKYAHVTFFFNGGSEPPKPGEERVLIPSPRIATYDLQPAMSEPEVASQLVEAIGARRAEFYVVNFANCDMVGHTGDLDAAVRAVQAVDRGVGEVVDATLVQGGAVVITADHGNAERMFADDGTPFTAHTTNRVPLIVAGSDAISLDDGILADVAPTVVDLLDLDAPAEWTGHTLIHRT